MKSKLFSPPEKRMKLINTIRFERDGVCGGLDKFIADGQIQHMEKLKLILDEARYQKSGEL